MMELFDNPALGLFFGNPTTDQKAGDMLLNLQFSAGEHGKTPQAYRTFVTRICKYGKKNGVMAIGGTEGATSGGNTTLPTLRMVAPRYGYTVHSSGHGEWVLVNKVLGTTVQSGFMPVIPAQGHTPGPHDGAHTARGIEYVVIRPMADMGGMVHVGVSHWLTMGTDPSTIRGQANLKLEAAIGAWAKQAGVGHDLVFAMGDTNMDDKHRNAFTGVPLTSCWDELGRWPITHPHPNGHGPTLDLIASYNRDHRVKCHSARALNDAQLPLPVDHYTVVAEYRVTPVTNK